MGRRKARKSNTNGLGRLILKDRFGQTAHTPDALAVLHTTEEESESRYMGSVTDQNDLDEFMTQATLAGSDFVAENERSVLITSNSFQKAPSLSKADVLKMREHLKHLTVPRRPKWDETTTREELHRLEREAFLDWRRRLAETEQLDRIKITPFEKNIEVWRQLWRVIERSDIVVQIVDARNPLLFRCDDLEEYVRELNKEKQNLLLLNKADLLTDHQRREWAKYLSSRGVQFRFFSAKAGKSAQELQELAAREAEAAEEEEDNGDEKPAAPEQEEEEEEEEEEEDETESHTHTHTDEPEKGKSEESQDGPVDPLDLLATVYSRDAIIEELVRLGDRYPRNAQGRFTVGMVGYPNVGKSSTINVLHGEKKVAVAATPGKTKHFQTIVIGDDILLCDCPGLVFPSFVSTEAEMVCNGLLPIDHLRNALPPMGLVAKRVARPVLELTYGLRLPKPLEHEDKRRPPTASELLQAYAVIRGFMTGQGRPDESRAARLILKDYVSGKLRHVHPPPGYSLKRDGPWREDVRETVKRILVERGIDLAHAASSTRAGPSSVSAVRKSKLTQPTVKGGDVHAIDVAHLEASGQSRALIAGRREGSEHVKGKQKRKGKGNGRAKKGVLRAQAKHSPVPVAQLRQAHRQQQEQQRLKQTQE